MRTSLLALALGFAAMSAQAAAPRIEVAQAWSRPAVTGAAGAGFMTLTNRGPADALVSVSTPLARETQIHRSSVSGGVASMQRLAKLDLPAGRAVTFGPGGYHLMFVGLKKPLNVGDAVPATLTFASGAKVQASFRVQVAPPGSAAPTHH